MPTITVLPNELPPSTAAAPVLSGLLALPVFDAPAPRILLNSLNALDAAGLAALGTRSIKLLRPAASVGMFPADSSDDNAWAADDGNAVASDSSSPAMEEMGILLTADARSEATDLACDSTADAMLPTP